MKSISNSDYIYFGIACQKAIPRFLLISVKYLCLSTFPKVADLIGGQSLITSHFLWQVCQTGKCISGTFRSTRRPIPFAFFLYNGRLEGVKSPKQSPALGSINGNRTTFMVKKMEVVSVGSHQEPLCTKQDSVTLKQLEVICMARKATGLSNLFQLPLPIWLLCRQVHASDGCRVQLVGGLSLVITEIKFVTLCSQPLLFHV